MGPFVVSWGHLRYHGTICGTMGPFVVSWGHVWYHGAVSSTMGQDHDLHATIGTAIGIVAGLCIQGGSSIRGGVTSGVKAGSLHEAVVIT